MSKKQQLREMQRRQQRRRSLTVAAIAIGVMVVLVGVVVALSTISRQPLPPVAKVTREAPAGAEAGGRAWGPKDAPIKIEEYLDYQCPVCGQFARTNEAEVVKAFAAGGKVRYEVKYFPVVDSISPGRESLDAAQAALCAADQDKFWAMHSTLFGNQFGEGIGNFSKVRLKQMAATVDGMDAAAFGQCLDSDKYQGQVSADSNAASGRGVNSTPTFFINGRRFSGASLPSVDLFKQQFAQVAPGVKAD